VRYQFAIRGERPVWLLLGALLLSVWAAASLMESLMEGFRAAYPSADGPRRFKDRMVAIVLVFVAAVPAVGASILVLSGSRLQQFLFPVHRMDPDADADADERHQLWDDRAGGGAAVLHWAETRPMRWRDVWPGAWIASFLWFLVTLIFSWYVEMLGELQRDVRHGGRRDRHAGVDLSAVGHCAVWLRIQRGARAPAPGSIELERCRFVSQFPTPQGRSAAGH
jgi:hypothetical protein